MALLADTMGSFDTLPFGSNKLCKLYECLLEILAMLIGFLYVAKFNLCGNPFTKQESDIL